MAYEALDTLLQTLYRILKSDDDLTTLPVKQRIISIHDKAVALQFNLKEFPEKGTIRDVATTAQDIVEYLFSPENLSDCGSIEPAVRLSNQLTELAEELGSTVGAVVDYCKSKGSVNNVRQLSDSPSSSRSDVDLTVSVEPTVRVSNRLGKLAEKLTSTARDLVDYSRSNDSVDNIRQLSDSHAVTSSSRPAPTSKDVLVGFEEDLNYSPAVSSSSRPVSTSKDVVGFEKDLLEIMDLLTFHSFRLKELAIVGMGGIGKTTLAKIVYNHPLIMERYDVRAWVTVSQNYSAENALLDLLASMKGAPKERAVQRNDMQNEIYRYLYGRRYLVVLDDVWSTEAWEEMRIIFPNNDNGSRIILTTRLQDIAAAFTYGHIHKMHFLEGHIHEMHFLESHIHEMHFLDADQSWHLFQQKVFGDEACPLDLQVVGKKIVRSCAGLPLSIVMVAELLSRIGRTPKVWEQIVASDENLETILYHSFNHLPHHLKECFLYMAGFPEGYEIRVSELIKLWVAEGFLECLNGRESLEEKAEDCLEELIKTSLVLVTSRKSDGNIKSCKLHTMVRDFCVRVAGQKKFLLPVMDYLPSPILRRHFLPRVLENHQRISATWYELDLKDSIHSSRTHSIICIPQKGYKPKGSVHDFSSLRVFHVLRRNDRLYWELGQVFDLIYLTYLASNIPSSCVPSTISQLENLQTLIIYRSEVHLPVEIWRMRQLRHLIAFSFHPLPHPEGATLPLKNFQTLSLATDFVCSQRMVVMIRNIKKLGVCYSGQNLEGGYHLHNLARLSQLEKLKLEMHSSLWPSLPVFPQSLKKLYLSGGIHSIDMTIIGSLPFLQVLKLRNYAFDGECWETTEGEFSLLRTLLIDDSNLREWITERSHFPRLQYLMLHRCPYLSEIPIDLGEIPTLELIEVDDQNTSLLHSVKELQEEQRDNGNDSLQVHLKRI